MARSLTFQHLRGNIHVQQHLNPLKPAECQTNVSLEDVAVLKYFPANNCIFFCKWQILQRYLYTRKSIPDPVQPLFCGPEGSPDLLLEPV